MWHSRKMSITLAEGQLYYYFSYDFFSIYGKVNTNQIKVHECGLWCGWVVFKPQRFQGFPPLMVSRRPKDLGTLRANQRGVGKTMVGDRNQFFYSKQEKINHGPLCEKVPCQQSAPWAKEDPKYMGSFLSVQYLSKYSVLNAMQVPIYYISSVHMEI